MVYSWLLIPKETEIDYPAEVLLVADDPGILDAKVVVVEHVNIKSVFVI